MRKELEVYFLWWVIYLSICIIAFIGSLVSGSVAAFIAADSTYLSVIIFCLLLSSFFFTGMSFYNNIFCKRIRKFNKFVIEYSMGLGMMGTLIGVAYLLNAFNIVDSKNPNAVTELSKHVGSGMGKAVYTTIAGLGSAMLTGINQYMILKFMVAKKRLNNHASI